MGNSASHQVTKVHCRTGSLETLAFCFERVKQVHCRTGSLEMRRHFRLASLLVHCRTGSLEMSESVKIINSRVHCRTGSLEIEDMSLRKQLCFHCCTGSRLQLTANHKNSLEAVSHLRDLPIFNVWISSYCLLAAAKSAVGCRSLVSAVALHCVLSLCITFIKRFLTYIVQVTQAGQPSGWSEGRPISYSRLSYRLLRRS